MDLHARRAARVHGADPPGGEARVRHLPRARGVRPEAAPERGRGAVLLVPGARALRGAGGTHRLDVRANDPPARAGRQVRGRAARERAGDQAGVQGLRGGGAAPREDGREDRGPQAGVRQPRQAALDQPSQGRAGPARRAAR